MVLAGGSELIDDVRRAPDDVLSVREERKKVRSAQNEELILMGIMHCSPFNSSTRNAH